MKLQIFCVQNLLKDGKYFRNFSHFEALGLSSIDRLVGESLDREIGEDRGR